VQHHVHPLALGGKGHVVHVHGPWDHVAGEGHGAARPDQPLRLRLLGRRDEVDGAELVVVAPPAPVVQLLEVVLDAVTAGHGGIGHGGILSWRGWSADGSAWSDEREAVVRGPGLVEAFEAELTP